MLSVCFPKNDRNPRATFAGSQRLLVGFLQDVMKFLTVPSDNVLDWTVEDGSAFAVGDFSG